MGLGLLKALFIGTLRRCPTPAESLEPERHSPPRSGAKADVDATPRCGLRNSRRVVCSEDLRICSVAPLADGTEHLRVLIANERKDRLALVAPIVVALGHEVIAREIEVQDVGAVTARERPDVALVGLGASSEHALDLIDKIVREAACPSLPSWPRSISRETSTGAPRLDASFVLSTATARRMPSTDPSAGRTCGDAREPSFAPRYPSDRIDARHSQTQRSV